MTTTTTDWGTRAASFFVGSLTFISCAFFNAQLILALVLNAANP